MTCNLTKQCKNTHKTLSHLSMAVGWGWGGGGVLWKMFCFCAAVTSLKQSLQHPQSLLHRKTKEVFKTISSPNFTFQILLEGTGSEVLGGTCLYKNISCFPRLASCQIYIYTKSAIQLAFPKHMSYRRHV